MALNEAHVQGQIPGGSSTRKSMCAAKTLEVLPARRHAAEGWMTFRRMPEEGTFSARTGSRESSPRAPEAGGRARSSRGKCLKAARRRYLIASRRGSGHLLDSFGQN